MVKKTTKPAKAKAGKKRAKAPAARTPRARVLSPEEALLEDAPAAAAFVGEVLGRGAAALERIATQFERLVGMASAILDEDDDVPPPNAIVPASTDAPAPAEATTA